MKQEPEPVEKRSALGHVLAWAMTVSMGSCFFMIIISIADVFSRHLLGQAIAGVFELSEVLMVLVVFLGLGAAQKEGSHIRAELVISHFSGRVRNGLDLFAHVLGFLFWGILFTQCAAKALESWSTGEYKEGLMKFPIWPARWAIAIGLLLICLQLLLDIYRTFGTKKISAARKG